MPATVLHTERGDGWSLVRLATQGGLNKLGSGTLEPLKRVIEDLVADPGCRCLAITGGGGSFAVGADLREIRRVTPRAAREFSEHGNAIFRMLENAAAAVVAGIDGFCLGGGLDLALAADWRLATARSVFGHPGGDLGLITGFGGTQRLPRLVGQRRAARWFFTGERVTAQEAYRAGLVQEVCADEEFDQRLRRRVEHFLALGPEAVSAVKRSLRGDLPLHGRRGEGRWLL